MTDHDLFGDRAEEYARTRPAYPEELLDLLARRVARRELAWDCGAGSGQTSRSLALRFARVKRYRSDKSAAEADTLATIQRIYQQSTGLPPPIR